MSRFIDSPLPSHYEIIIQQLEQMGVPPLDTKEYEHGVTEFCFDRNDWLAFADDVEQTHPEAYDFIAHACAYLPIWETCSSCGKDISYNYMIFRTELLDEFVKAVIPDVYDQWSQAFSESGGEV